LWDKQWKTVLNDVLTRGQSVKRTDNKRNIIELVSYQFHLDDPLDRLLYSEARGLNIFQCMGQFLWITQGNFNLEAIKYYQPISEKFSSDGVRVIGAYGPRLFGIEHLNQMNHVAHILAEDPSKRRAVASIYLPQFDQHELANEEVPCTLNLQYLVRDQKLQTVIYMRSQDAFKVLPYDVFIFTMLQEYLQNLLKPEHDITLGRYNHFAGSFHIYEDDIPKVQEVLGTNSSSDYKMDPMPSKDIKFRLRDLNKFESTVRTIISAKIEHGYTVDFNSFFKMLNELKDEYWIQLGLLLICYGAIKVKDSSNQGLACDKLNPEYKRFIDIYLKKFNV